MTAHGWTVDEAAAEFERAGVPIDPYRLRKLLQALQVRPVGETRSGERGGRGHALYDIAQLQQIHGANAKWLIAARDRMTPPGDT